MQVQPGPTLLKIVYEEMCRDLRQASNKFGAENFSTGTGAYI